MTIAAVVEGIVLATRSAVLAVTPAPKPKPPAPKPGPEPGPQPGPSPEPLKPKTWTDWLKDQIKKIANLLLKLGDKVLIALPGIIGAALNFVLESAGTVVGFLADHLWAFALVVGGILYTSVKEFYNPPTRRGGQKKRKNPITLNVCYGIFLCSVAGFGRFAGLLVYLSLGKNATTETIATPTKIKESFLSS